MAGAAGAGGAGGPPWVLAAGVGSADRRSGPFRRGCRFRRSRRLGSRSLLARSFSSRFVRFPSDPRRLSGRAPTGPVVVGASTGPNPTSGGGAGGSGALSSDGSVTSAAAATAAPAASFATFTHLIRRPRMPTRSPRATGSPPAVRPSLKLRPLWRESTNWC